MIEDDIQDKVCLYNEIIDVLRCVYFIFLEKHANKLKKYRLTEKMDGDTNLADAIKITTEKFMDRDCQALEDERVIREGYTISIKYLI